MTQLSLFGDETPDNRPLPRIVASKWDFPLQHYQTDTDYFYAVQDWIAGLTSDTNTAAQKLWAKMKKQLSTSSRQLDYLASNGKTYSMDFVDDEGLYLIAQHLRSTSKRTVLKDIKSYLAAAGVMVDEMRLDPSKAIEAGIDKYQQQGKADTWIEARANGIFSRKAFTAALKASIVDMNDKTYGMATETLYKGLWQRTSRQLRGELNLAPKQNIRDAMSSIALTYTSIAEIAAAHSLGEAEEVPETVAMEIIYKVAALINKQAHETAAYLGIDAFTGQPLLNGATS